MVQPEGSAPRRPRLGVDLTILALIGVLLIAALGAGGAALYQQFYSPAAFVARYLDLLSSGRAADALRVSGVAVDRTVLEAAGIDGNASEALLRRAALAPLTDVHLETEQDGDVYHVTAGYQAAGHNGTTEFEIVQDGWVGVTPNWRFAKSPLAEIELVVRGADTFAVNGFELDRRQVAIAGTESAPLDPVHLLVFTPGVYSVTVKTPIASSPGVSVLADAPLTHTPVDVQTQPTKKFRDVVQQRVEQFLTTCTTQKVLQPTACPFGLEVRNRLAPDSLPKWSITAQPQVAVIPDGANWRIEPSDAVAHIEVDIQSLFDGSIEHVSEDVPFSVDGTITILSDGSASIRVGSPTAPDLD
ncbi:MULTISPECIES: hypothetical protein [unclassified Microbacterium]|uniref:hypothetical protein n=1 Tax=unclassified Microbacterium TaxID=2609290 RepID=UPI0012FC2698|nr:hypothetical protein [Microbacterium sp. MAH-37]MVQ43909.1 hypothetical protein [Microbacterium sp. MAH-37]